MTTIVDVNMSNTRLQPHNAGYISKKKSMKTNNPYPYCEQTVKLSARAEPRFEKCISRN